MASLTRALVILAFCFTVFLAQQAGAATPTASVAGPGGNMPGSVCYELGKTMLSDDKANIIACVCRAGNCTAATSGNLVWAAMSANNATCDSDKMLKGYSEGKPVCVQQNLSCSSKGSQYAVVDITNGVPTCGKITAGTTTAGTTTPTPPMRKCPYYRTNDLIIIPSLTDGQDIYTNVSSYVTSDNLTCFGQIQIDPSCQVTVGYTLPYHAYPSSQLLSIPCPTN